MGERRYCYFQSYSGVRLPVRLVGPLSEVELSHRNTYLRAWFDDEGRLSGWEKMVYGEIQISHLYEYYPGGGLIRAEIHMEGEVSEMLFDEAGAKL